MDGTLVDTEGLWWEAVEEVAGRPLTEADRPDVLGRPVEHTAAWLAAATGASADDLAALLHREFADRVRGEKNVHIGPSDYVAWLDDRKWAYVRLEGRAF
ncbi:hypothetical protein AB0C77_11460, partial [Streptomyces sp. NPDC048629]